MSVHLVKCTNLRFGIPDAHEINAPVANLPDGARVRFKFRNDSFVLCFVKTQSVITSYHPEFKDGQWHLNESYRQGCNHRL